MKWDETNKGRVWKSLKDRASQLDHDSWQAFSESCGIIQVYRGHQIKSRSMVWMQMQKGGSFKFAGDSFAPAASRKHIIIDDIFHDNPGWGLKIPKEIALKFLVLGIP